MSPTSGFAVRSVALALCLAGVLLATPAQAQRRADVVRQAPVALSETPGALSLGTLFNAETLDLSQSYEFSMTGGAGGSLGLGVYTTSLRWQPSSKLAGRVDVAAAHSPFGSSGIQSSLGFDGDTPARLYLRNAELAYKPTDNSTIHLSFQQSPFGRCVQPTYGRSCYGSGSNSGYGASGYGAYGRAVGGSGDLFFRDVPPAAGAGE